MMETQTQTYTFVEANGSMALLLDGDQRREFVEELRSGSCPIELMETSEDGEVERYVCRDHVTEIVIGLAELSEMEAAAVHAAITFSRLLGMTAEGSNVN